MNPLFPGLLSQTGCREAFCGQREAHGQPRGVHTGMRLLSGAGVTPGWPVPPQLAGIAEGDRHGRLLGAAGRALPQGNSSGGAQPTPRCVPQPGQPPAANTACWAPHGAASPEAPRLCPASCRARGPTRAQQHGQCSRDSSGRGEVCRSWPTASWDVAGLRPDAELSTRRYLLWLCCQVPALTHMKTALCR